MNAPAARGIWPAETGTRTDFGLGSHPQAPEQQRPCASPVIIKNHEHIGSRSFLHHVMTRDVYQVYNKFLSDDLLKINIHKHNNMNMIRTFLRDVPLE